MNTMTDEMSAMRDGIERALASALIAPQAIDGRVSSGEDVALPCRELLFSGGKRWRPMLLVMFATATTKSSSLLAGHPLLEADEIFSLCPLVEFPHNASLIHDDIEDGATTRRGKQCAHIKYGVDVALNAASWLYFKAAECIDSIALNDSTKCKLHKMYNKAICALHEGQALDIAWHKAQDFFPTVEQYTSMTAKKTGALAALAMMAGFVISGAEEDGAKQEKELSRLNKAGMTIGTAFQALDDARDIMEGNPGKERGDDIVEGKKSLPVLLHLSEHIEDKERIASLFRRAQKEGIKSVAVEECIELLTKSKAALMAKEKAIKLCRTALDAMPNEDIRAFVRKVLNMDEGGE